MAFDHDAQVQIDGRQRAIEHLDEVRKRLERERNEARRFHTNEHTDRVAAETARDALHIALTELVRLHDLKLADPREYERENAMGAKDEAWSIAARALVIERETSQEPCADQLTDVIFCQLPKGHTGAHQHKWSAHDPVAMWERRESTTRST